MSVSVTSISSEHGRRDPDPNPVPQFPSFLAFILLLGYLLLKPLFEYEVSPLRLLCLEEAQEAMPEAWWPPVPEEHHHLDFLSA